MQWNCIFKQIFPEYGFQKKNALNYVHMMLCHSAVVENVWNKYAGHAKRDSGSIYFSHLM